MRFFLVWRVWGHTGKYLFSDTAAEAGILSFRKFAKTMPEAKYCYTSCRCIRKQIFSCAVQWFRGRGKRKGIGYREKDAMYGCAGMEDYRIV